MKSQNLRCEVRMSFLLNSCDWGRNAQSWISKLWIKGWFGSDKGGPVEPCEIL